MGQLSLDFDAPTVAAVSAEPETMPTPEESSDLEARALAWIDQNPEVYTEFVRAAWRLRNAGHKVFGAKGIAEEMRRNGQLQPTRSDGYKINNSYVSYIGDRLIEDDPSFRQFIRPRKRKKGGSNP